MRRVTARVPTGSMFVVFTLSVLVTGCAIEPSPPTVASATTAADATGNPATSPPASATEPTSGPTTSPPTAPTTATPGAAASALAGLRVAGRGPRTGYARTLFGPAWADTDRNGCDTRNDMLRRDLTALVFRPGTAACVVLSGVRDDPYTDSTISFQRGGRSEIDIDHVVALGNAWVSGAARWSPSRRLMFANDPLNLLAVDASANRQKGDGDAATWLPPNRAFRCTFVARQIAVKSTYDLSVTPAEKSAMQRILSTCPNQPLPSR